MAVCVWLTAAVLLFWSPTATAQLGPSDDHLGADFLQSQLSGGFSSASTRSFKDVEGTFGSKTASITAIVPLYQTRDVNAEGAGTYFLLGRGQFSALEEDISFLPSSHTVYKPQVGLTGGIGTANHHLYLLTVGVGFAEDRNSVDNARIRTTGSLLGKYHLDNSFAFIYGLSYSYVFDRGLLLPLLGAHCSLGDDLKLHLVLPFSLGISYVETREFQFGLAIRASGDQFHIEESDYFGAQSLPLFLKIAQVQMGLNVLVEISENLWLQGEAGVLAGRKLSIGTLNDNLVSSKVQNSGYSSIIIKYRLGSIESW